MNVAVIGAGKMGLPLACVFASRGATVAACDVNPEIVKQINAGECPFDEPGISPLLTESLQQRRLTATTDIGGAIGRSQVIVVIVPVLLNAEQQADLTIIDSIAALLAQSLKRGSLACFETTLPVGGTRRLGSLIAKGGLKPGMDFDLAFSPERVKSRLIIKHLFNNPKVVGGITPQGAARAERFYREFLGAPVINVGTLEAAELVKLAGMVYRDVNIALANELARYAEKVGVDFELVRKAANTDGEACLLEPGIGVGGHCTPVYPYFLIQDARRQGLPLELVEAGRRRNEEQPDRVMASLGEISGKRVVILGLGFRPEVKEVAYSPAFALQKALQARGAIVTLHDPYYTAEEIRRHGFDPGAIAGHEIAVLNTAHQEYQRLDYARLAAAGVRCIVDGRNCLNPELVRSSGIKYIGIGQVALP